jgi:alcohol dehydrogenase class IV
LNNLLTAIRDGKNIKARTDMSYAAFMAMLGSTSGYSMGHVMGHAIAEVSGVHNHGFLCASIMPYNVEFLAECFPQNLRKIAAFLKVDTAGKSDAEIGAAVREALRIFFRECGVPPLKELGMKPSDMPEIVRHSTSGTWYLLAPKRPSEEETHV